MATETIHQADVGTLFDITVTDSAGNALSLATATVVNFIFRKPDGTILTAAGTFKTDGTDGVVQYSTAAGDLDQSGTWQYQIYYEMAGQKKHSDIAKFKVLANLGG